MKKNKLKQLEELVEKLCYCDSDNLYISDCEKIILTLERISRKETNVSYSKVFSNEKLANKVIEIGEKNKSNTLLLSRILSLIGNMYRRYNLNISNNIWKFYLECTTISGAAYFVYLFLPLFPQFEDYKHKWDFIARIPYISPKKKSIQNFYALITTYVNKGILIPKKAKMIILLELKKIITSDKIGEITKHNFINLLNKIQEPEF